MEAERRLDLSTKGKRQVSKHLWLILILTRKGEVCITHTPSVQNPDNIYMYRYLPFCFSVNLPALTTSSKRPQLYFVHKNSEGT